MAHAELRDARRLATEQNTTEPIEQTIAALWKAYRDTRCEAAKARLTVHYMKTHVKRIAQRLHASLPRQVDVDDLVQQGYLGLVDAMERFETERDIKFETFSSARIYGAMQDYLRKIDPTSRQARKFSKLIQAAEDHFLKTEGRRPTDDELQAALGVEDVEFRRMLVHRNPAMTVSYHGRAGLEEDGDDADALAGLEDRDQPTPLRAAEESGLRDWIVRTLDRRDRLILILYYYEELTMKEVGRTLGISESRVSQRLDSIIKCLRSRLSFRGADKEFIFG